MLKKVLNDPYIETLRHLRGLCRQEMESLNQRQLYISDRINQLDISINKRKCEVNENGETN